MGDIVKFSCDKTTAMKLARKAIGDKMAILSTSDSVIKAGTPPFMIVTITFSDNSAEFGGSPMLLGTAKSAIELAFDDYKNDSSSASPSKSSAGVGSVSKGNNNSLELEKSLLEMLEKYLLLKEKGAVPEELYEKKKAKILELLEKNDLESSPMLIVQEEPAAQQVLEEKSEPQPKSSSIVSTNSSSQKQQVKNNNPKQAVTERTKDVWLCDCGFRNVDTPFCGNCFKYRTKK